MDIVGTILNCMEESPASITKENQVTKNDHDDENTSYYWCEICGNLYTDRKKFINHKSVHQQNQKSKSCAFTEQEKTVQNPLSYPLKTEYPSKSLDDLGLNASKVQKPPSYKCLVCGKLYTVRKKFSNHMHNHKRNEKKGKKQVNRVANKNTKPLPTSATSNELPLDLAYIPLATSQINGNKLPSPSKNVIVNPSSNEQIWKCNQEVKSVDAHQVDHFSEESQSKSILPEKKSSYKCKICDRIFTVRKTFLNHKTNHTHNRNTGKLFFFKRGTERQQIHNASNKNTGK